MPSPGKTVKAVYHDGVLELKEPLALSNGAEVTVVIEPAASLSEDEQWERFRAAAGAWQGIVDSSIKDELRALRHLKTRPEVPPWQ